MYVCMFFSVYSWRVRSWWLKTEIHLSQGSRLHKKTCTVSIGNARLALLILTGPAYKLLSGQADNPDDRWQQRGGGGASLCSATSLSNFQSLQTTSAKRPGDWRSQITNISFIPADKWMEEARGGGGWGWTGK